jgi:alpha-L-fucosidase 2
VRRDAGENFVMPSLLRQSFAVLLALCLLQSSRAAEATSPLTLFYTNAAVKWTEALPIGNGRLGAMIFGGVEREHLQLNEGTLWAGGPYDPSNTNALAALPEARKLVFEGKYDEASKLIGEKMMAVPLREMAYQTMGDLWLDFPTNAVIENYRRDLDLDTAVATVSYRGPSHRRQTRTDFYFRRHDHATESRDEH